MGSGFRASMNWLHTWAGIVLGALLFTIFWMGTLSVFDREIDRWMAPMTRLTLPVTMPGQVGGPSQSYDMLRPLYDDAVAAKARSWFVVPASEREPFIRVSWRDRSGSVMRLVDPATGDVLPAAETLGGTRFLFPFHYGLHIKLWQLGYWLVGVAAMTMLVLCVSGVVVHRKIFAEFFTFRADKKPRRLILDLHNVVGVLGLPFYVAISLSGLIIFWSIYFPGTSQLAYQGDRQAYSAEMFNVFTRPKLGREGRMSSFDAMVLDAKSLWDGQPPRYLFVREPGDAAAIVQIGRLDDASVDAKVDIVYFDAGTGALLHNRSDPRPVMTAQRFIAGMHLIQFRHWSLRWLYFGLGLTGCAVIATGYLFWLESRRTKHLQLGLRGVRIVEGLTIGSVSGILIATLVFFVMNRLLPLGSAFLGQERSDLEVWAFYLVWLAAFVHAWARSSRAWIEQCQAIAVLAVAAVLLNALTTGDHLARSLVHSHLWSVGGMDLLLLFGALLAALTVRHLKRRRSGLI